MSNTAQVAFAGRLLDRQRLERIADGLVVAIAASLPWSISASAVLIAVWLVFLLPTLDIPALRRTLVLPAGGLPVLLCGIALLGMTWTDAALDERFSNWTVFLRLCVIALLLVQFQRSDRGRWVLLAFAASCMVLLVLSWVQWSVPAWAWRRNTPGVPVKDHIIQSGEFLICAFALGHLSLNCWSRGMRGSAIALALIATCFLANIAFVAAARSVLAIFVVLVFIFGFQRFRARGLISLAVLVAIFSLGAWTTSPYLQERVLRVVHEISDYRSKQAETSAGYRLEFWRKSIAIISEAPIFGHGTGSVRQQFGRSATDNAAISAVVTDNPHHQTLVVAIQLGLLGTALLYAMWLAHLLLFRGGGLVSWIGIGVVVHAIGAGLFSSQLFEATLGWVYIFGVGVLGGMALRSRPAGLQPNDPRSSGGAEG